MPDEAGTNPVKGAIEALYKPIESIVKTLAGPAAEEIGLSFRDSVQVWRFKRQVRLFERVKKICNDAGIKPQAVKPSLLFDVVDKATLEEDDDLQDRWANLLANAADSRGMVLVKTAFPDILRQISREEAAYIDDLFDIMQKAEVNLIRTYDEEEQEHTPQLDAVSYDNLQRLRLIDGNPETIPAVAVTASLEELERGGNRYKRLTQETYQLTFLGEAFVKACKAPKAD
jgi:Abortive infection alpha